MSVFLVAKYLLSMELFRCACLPFHPSGLNIVTSATMTPVANVAQPINIHNSELKTDRYVLKFTIAVLFFACNTFIGFAKPCPDSYSLT